LVTSRAVGHSLDAVEDFGLALAEHFLVHHPQLSRVRVDLTERPWGRLADLARFGVQNANEVYLPTAELDSLVTATVTRDNRASS